MHIHLVITDWVSGSFVRGWGWECGGGGRERIWEKLEEGSVEVLTMNEIH